MSAFYSFVYPDRVQVLTDCAYFDQDGIVQAIREKVARSKRLPVAMTGRGRYEDVAAIINKMMSFDRGGSVDGMLAAVRKHVAELSAGKSKLDAEILIACFSENKGPVHYFFNTHGRYDAVRAYRLVRMPAQFGAGPEIAFTDLPEKAQTADVTSPMFPILHGVDILEAMRRKPASVPGYDKQLLGVGGHCQLTSVTRDRALTMTLCSWSDEVGKAISLSKTVGCDEARAA